MPTTAKETTERKFTPGPWTISGAHPWIVQCETRHQDIKGDVASVGYRPNASLIAAAPDLYEALLAVAMSGQLSPALADQAVAALNKARGETK